MELSTSFELSDQVVTEASLDGNRLKIAAYIDPDLFMKVYKDQIGVVGLSSEKAFYLAMKTYKTASPTPTSLMRQVMR